MSPPPRIKGFVALERALSKLGLASRTEARALIEAGRVRIDGRRVSDPRTPVMPERVKISIDGLRLERAAWRLVLLHKPRGVVTTKRDPEGRRTVYDVLRVAGDSDWLDRLVPVGRLDLASTGVLLLTSDTQLADWLTDPRNAIVRRYVVTIRGELHPDAQTSMPAFAELRRGKPGATLRVLKRSKRETHLIVELTEGKNREIRRMFQAIGHEVTRLKRIAFGGLELGDLQPGKWREVSRDEARAAFPDAPSPKPQAPRPAAPKRLSGREAAKAGRARADTDSR